MTPFEFNLAKDGLYKAIMALAKDGPEQDRCIHTVRQTELAAECTRHDTLRTMAVIIQALITRSEERNPL